MWNLIPRKLIPPTRVIRYCCDELKEAGGKGSFVAMGIRWAESKKRSNRKTFEITKVKKDKRLGVMSMDNEQDRQAFESCPIKGERVVSPMIDWSNEEIWDYIEAEHLETNPLYQCGFDRIGCIGCPLVNKHQREFEFSQYPKFKENYIRTFDRMLDERRKRGKMEGEMRWGNTGEEVFEWWMQ